MLARDWHLDGAPGAELCPLEDGGPEVAFEAVHGELAEAPAVKMRRSPDAPTAAEIADHEATHEPYRAWCRACVAGRGLADRHVVSIDYAYLTEREDGTTPILVGKDSKHRWYFGTPMPSKGASHAGCAKALALRISLAGHEEQL